MCYGAPDSPPLLWEVLKVVCEPFQESQTDMNKVDNTAVAYFNCEANEQEGHAKVELQHLACHEIVNVSNCTQAASGKRCRSTGVYICTFG